MYLSTIEQLPNEIMTNEITSRMYIFNVRCLAFTNRNMASKLIGVIQKAEEEDFYHELYKYITKNGFFFSWNMPYGSKVKNMARNEIDRIIKKGKKHNNLNLNLWFPRKKNMISYLDCDRKYWKEGTRKCAICLKVYHSKLKMLEHLHSHENVEIMEHYDIKRVPECGGYVWYSD